MLRYCLGIFPLSQEITASWIRVQMSRHSIPTAAELILSASFRHAVKSVKGGLPHQLLREERDRVFWEWAKDRPYKQRYSRCHAL